MLNNILNYVKQYGILVSFKRLFFKIIKPFYYRKNNFILCIDNHSNKKNDSDVKIMNKENLIELLNNEIINDFEYNRFLNFLNSNCIGYYIINGCELAAWGFTQIKGKYLYGENIFQIPNNVNVLRNLFVKPKFRGMSLGKKINECRINNVPSNVIPCVFVITDNQYAIRNLKIYGFKTILSVKQYKFFSYFKKKYIKIIKNNKYSHIIIKGLR